MSKWNFDEPSQIWSRIYASQTAKIQLVGTDYAAEIHDGKLKNPISFGYFSTLVQAQEAIEDYYRDLDVTGEIHCDICGKKLTETEMSMHSFVTLYGPRDDKPDMTEPYFEWSQCGDYCEEHAYALANTIAQKLSEVLPERYDRLNTDARIAKETDFLTE